MASGRQRARDARKLMQASVPSQTLKDIEEAPSARIASAGPVFKTPPPEGLMKKVRKRVKKVLKKEG